MKAFADYHPMVLFVYFLCIMGISMFTMHPLVTGISFIGAMLFFLLRSGRKHGRSHLYFFGMFLLLVILNPLFSHHGTTVLFVMNHNPVTLESLIYGICASGGMLAVLYQCRNFSGIMTRDKLLYVFGKLSPKAALVLSMAIRYISLFSDQMKKVLHAQKALGTCWEDTFLDKIRTGLRVSSIMLTWALENGIITADSMAARGYGIGKRTQFSLFRMDKKDAALLIAVLLLTAAAFVGMPEITFYPEIILPDCTPMQIAGITANAILALLPCIIEMEESLKWKYFLSKI